MLGTRKDLNNLTASPSPLTEYFNNDESSLDKLHANIGNYFNKALEGNNAGLIGRCFNDIDLASKPFEYVQPLIDTINEATDDIEISDEENDTLGGSEKQKEELAQKLITTYPALKAWLDFALAHAMNDILDQNGNIKEEIKNLLNHQNHYQAIENAFNADTIKKQLVSGYILGMLSAEASHKILATQTIEDAENRQRLYSIFTVILNKYLNNLKNINKEFMEKNDEKLESFTHKYKHKNPTLVEAISNFQYFQFNQAKNELERTLTDNSKDEVLRNQGRRVLHALEKIKETNSKNPNLTKLIHVMRSTKAIIDDPAKADLGGYLKQAKDVGKNDKHSKKRILAGVMLGLAGAALIGLSVGVALASFGVLSPVSVLGITLGASLIAGGIAVGAGTLTLGAVATSEYLLFKHKPVEKEMIELKEIASSKKPKQN